MPLNKLGRSMLTLDVFDQFIIAVTVVGSFFVFLLCLVLLLVH